MDQFDREKAQRVWQRVQSNQPAPPPKPPAQPNPEGLLLEELIDIRLLQQLARQQREPLAGLLRSLIAQGQGRASALRGICQLSGLTPPSALPKADTPALANGLRRLMGQLLRRRMAYRQLDDHPEYGPLYDSLAQETQASALALAKIIGR